MRGKYMVGVLNRVNMDTGRTRGRLNFMLRFVGDFSVDYMLKRLNHKVALLFETELNQIIT